MATPSLSNPALRVLYTVVEPQEKYTAQNFIDTVVFRGGDAASVVWNPANLALLPRTEMGAGGALLPAGARAGQALHHAERPAGRLDLGPPKEARGP